MKKTLLIGTAIMALTATAAFASGGGLGLHVGDCNGASALVNNCALNTGSLVLVGSVTPDADSPRMVAEEVVIDISNGGSALSDWWRLDGAGTGGCRNAMTSTEDFTAVDANGNPVYSACVDYWAGSGSGAQAFVYPSPGTGLPGGSGRIALVAASAFEKLLPGGVQSYMFRIQINKTLSLGTGACGGCADPVHLYFNNCKLLQTAGAAGGDVDVSGTGAGQDCTYNGGNAPTSTQKTSWGSIKALYR
ncbi:MAG: hypothetical protein ACRENS_11695 [Candidatus Eiseniibacteriota bacterium]